MVCVPQSIDYETLSGNIKLEAQGGQFPKFELGISKLFGIFDLRSLPRRMLLDFRDVFSAGFAFDEFSGDFNIAYGVASTNNVKIKGPAAEVVMNGQIDLLKETQKLHITVTPSLGLVAPIVGVATVIESIIKIKHLRIQFFLMSTILVVLGQTQLSLNWAPKRKNLMAQNNIYRVRSFDQTQY